MALSPRELETLKQIQAKRQATPVAPQAAVTTNQTPAAQPSVATVPQGERTFSDRAKDLVGGALYGISAPGRFIQNKIFNPTLNAIGLGGPDATKEGFEQSLGVDVDTTSGKVGTFVGETVPMAVTGSAVGAAVKNAPLLARAGAMGAASFTQQSINQQEINSSSVAAGATDAALPVLGRFARVGADVLKGLAGGVSGAGVDVIEAALARPGAAFKAAGKGDAGDLKKLSETIRAGAKQLYKKAGTEYAETVAKAGVAELPKDDVIKGVTETLAELADANVADDGLRLIDTPFTDVEERQLQKMYNTVKNWGDFTPQGVNTLATRISKFRRGAQDSASFDRVVDGVRRYVRGYVGDKYPEIATAVSTFSDRMDLLDEIDNVLKTSPELGTREGIRKTAESLGRIFNANKEFSREAIESFEKEVGVDIIGTMAGQQLSQTAPRSSARIGDLVMNLVQPLGSVAARNAVPLVGAIKLQVVDRILSVPGIEPSVRASIVQAVSELFAEPDDDIPQTAQNKSGTN